MDIDEPITAGINQSLAYWFQCGHVQRIYTIKQIRYKVAKIYWYDCYAILALVTVRILS